MRLDAIHVMPRKSGPQYEALKRKFDRRLRKIVSRKLPLCLIMIGRAALFWLWVRVRSRSSSAVEPHVLETASSQAYSNASADSVLL
jgi:hypothetical protein